MPSIINSKKKPACKVQKSILKNKLPYNPPNIHWSHLSMPDLTKSCMFEPFVRSNRAPYRVHKYMWPSLELLEQGKNCGIIEQNLWLFLLTD